MISEQDLDRAFADKVAASPDFLRWVLKNTEFRELADDLILLDGEQAEAKPAKNQKIGGDTGGVAWMMAVSLRQISSSS